MTKSIDHLKQRRPMRNFLIVTIGLVLSLPQGATAQETDGYDIEEAKATARSNAIELTDSVAWCNGVALAASEGFAGLPNGQPLSEMFGQMANLEFAGWVAGIIDVPASRFQEIQDEAFDEALNKINATATEEARAASLSDVMQNELGPCSNSTMLAETEMMIILAPFALSGELQEQDAGTRQ